MFEFTQFHFASSKIKFDALRERQFGRIVDSIGLSTHVTFPRIRAAFAPAAGFFLTAERSARFLSAFDVDGGYVVSPRPEGVQISGGTELTALHSKPSFHLFAKSQARAEQALELGAPTIEEVAIGNRPTLPDSLPVIGPATG